MEEEAEGCPSTFLSLETIPSTWLLSTRSLGHLPSSDDVVIVSAQVSDA